MPLVERGLGFGDFGGWGLRSVAGGLVCHRLPFPSARRAPTRQRDARLQHRGNRNRRRPLDYGIRHRGDRASSVPALGISACHSAARGTSGLLAEIRILEQVGTHSPSDPVVCPPSFMQFRHEYRYLPWMQLRRVLGEPLVDEPARYSKWRRRAVEPRLSLLRSGLGLSRLARRSIACFSLLSLLNEAGCHGLLFCGGFSAGFLQLRRALGRPIRGEGPPHTNTSRSARVRIADARWGYSARSPPKQQRARGRAAPRWSPRSQEP
jgi:hypothetical protein